MVTVIRIDLTWRQTVLVLAATLAALPAGYGAEMEIYVTMGQDGVEIFSNLPRAPVAVPGKAASASRSSAIAVASPAGRLHPPMSEASRGQGSETETFGKSFLVDD